MRASVLPLVVVSGWGMPPWLLDGCLPEGRPLYRITPEQMLAAKGNDPEDAVARQLPLLPERAIWVGWSLGGQLAMAAAAQVPDRVAGVVTLCSSPRFMASDDWSPAVAPRVFDDFRRRLRRSPYKTLSHFCSLMVHGSDRAGEDRRWLRRADWPDPPAQWCLEHTLGWLGALDQRALWQNPMAPSWHLFGEQDALAPPAAGWATGIPGDRWQVISGMAHWPGGYFADQTRRVLEQWCNQVME